MQRICTKVALGTIFGLCSALAARAQTPWPHIASVTQSGGQRGKTIELKIVGVNIGTGTGLMLEGDGLTVESLTQTKELKPDSPLTARVKIAADAEPGWRAFRVLTPLGASDLGHFAIGQWPEVTEKEPNNTPAQAQEVRLPVTVTGNLDPGEDIDCFRFRAESGQTLVFDLFASRIESALEPVISIQDESGKEVALKQDFRQQDTPLIFSVPKAGTYVLILRDLNYRGSASHTYRLTMGAIPYVTGVLPSGGTPGSTLNLQLTGVNLGSEASCRVTLPQDPPAQPFARALFLPTGLSNSILLTTGALPEQSQSGANFTLATAQNLPIPSVVNGRLYHPGTAAGAREDDYRFHAAQGQKVILEVMARRLGSPLDSVLTVLDTNGKELASNDDALGADSRLEFDVPRTGDYFARLTDLNQRQGPDFVYRLTARVAEPDFRLSFVPERLSIGQGGAIPLTVTAARQYGFDGEIALEFAGLPAGVRILGDPKIRAGKNDALFVLTADANAPIQASPFHVTGTAALKSKPVRHAAESLREEYVKRDDRIERRTPATVMPVVAVASPPDMAVTAAPDHLTLARGKTVEIKVKIARKTGFTAKVPLAILGLPDNVTATLSEIAEKQNEATISLKAEGNAPLGDVTLIVLGKAVLDELRFVPHAALPISLTIIK